MKAIEKNIYRDILEISDLSLQKKLWLNQNNDTGLISSYTELMCRLFDDNDFIGFIRNYSIKTGGPLKIISELNTLKELLVNYSNKNDDQEIISDPNWGIIVNQAKNTIEEWNKL